LGFFHHSGFPNPIKTKTGRNETGGGGGGGGGGGTGGRGGGKGGRPANTPTPGSLGKPRQKKKSGSAEVFFFGPRGRPPNFKKKPAVKKPGPGKGVIFFRPKPIFSSLDGGQKAKKFFAGPSGTAGGGGGVSEGAGENFFPPQNFASLRFSANFLSRPVGKANTVLRPEPMEASQFWEPARIPAQKKNGFSFRGGSCYQKRVGGGGTGGPRAKKKGGGGGGGKLDFEFTKGPGRGPTGPENPLGGGGGPPGCLRGGVGAFNARIPVGEAHQISFWGRPFRGGPAGGAPGGHFARFGRPHCRQKKAAEKKAKQAHTKGFTLGEILSKAPAGGKPRGLWGCFRSISFRGGGPTGLPKKSSFCRFRWGKNRDFFGKGAGGK